MRFSARTIFSRLLILMGAIGVIVFTYLLANIALTPVPVPPAKPVPASVTFDTKLDVSKHAIFNLLRPLGPADLTPVSLGRSNPFLPPVTSTEIITAPTTTTTATTTR